MPTPNLSLTQPAFRSDGEIAATAVNNNFSTIDQLIDNVVCNDGAIVTHNGSIVICY